MPTKSGWEYVRNKGDQIFANGGVEPDVITATRLIARVTSNAARNDTRRGQPSGHVYDVQLLPEKAMEWSPDSWKCSCKYGFWSEHMTTWGIRYRPCSHVWAAIKYWAAHPEDHKEDTGDISIIRDSPNNALVEIGDITDFEFDDSQPAQQDTSFFDSLDDDMFGSPTQTTQPAQPAQQDTSFFDSLDDDMFGSTKQIPQQDTSFFDSLDDDMFGTPKKQPKQPKQASLVTAIDSQLFKNQLDPMHPLFEDVQVLLDDIRTVYKYKNTIIENNNIDIDHRLEFANEMLLVLDGEIEHFMPRLQKTPEAYQYVQSVFSSVVEDIQKAVNKLRQFKDLVPVSSKDLTPGGWLINNQLTNRQSISERSLEDVATDIVRLTNGCVAKMNSKLPKELINESYTPILNKYIDLRYYSQHEPLGIMSTRLSDDPITIAFKIQTLMYAPKDQIAVIAQHELTHVIDVLHRSKRSQRSPNPARVMMDLTRNDESYYDRPHEQKAFANAYIQLLLKKWKQPVEIADLADFKDKVSQILKRPPAWLETLDPNIWSHVYSALANQNLIIRKTQLPNSSTKTASATGLMDLYGLDKPLINTLWLVGKLFNEFYRICYEKDETPDVDQLLLKTMPGVMIID